MNIIDGTDALVYGSMANTLTDPTSLDYYDQNLQPRGLVTQNINNPNQLLNGLVSSQNIKRACCLGNVDPKNPNNYLVSVRLYGKGSGGIVGTLIGNLQSKYNYTDKIVSVPKSLCGSFTPRSTNCDNFYSVYCKNIINDFITKTGNTTFDSNFKPECACYAPTPQVIIDSGVNAPPKCYMPGCEVNSGVYLDPNSSQAGTNCSLTICQANIDISKLTAGNNINIANKIQQNCGPGKGTGTGTGTPTPTTPPPTTPPPTTPPPTTPSTQPTPPITSRYKLPLIIGGGIIIFLLIIFIFLFLYYK